MAFPLSRAIVLLVFLLAASAFADTVDTAREHHKVMLLTGQSNSYHNWRVSSSAIRETLEDTGLFDVEVVTTPPSGENMRGFAPNWFDYDAVVLDYEGAEWPGETKSSFVEYMHNGGGLVVVHAADNAFPYWPAFNEMIGLGGWGGAKLHNPPLTDDPQKYASRNEAWGPRVYWRGGEAVRDSSPGGASHPPPHDWLVTVRNQDHPITRDLPEMWLQGADELYSGLRGPAKNLTVLATGFANPAYRAASPYNEPVLFTVQYGKGRVFHTTLGHVGADEKTVPLSLRNVSFIVTLQRGVEWAATGEVAQTVPDDFPHSYQTSYRPAKGKQWRELLDTNLSQWEVFTGIPHSSVTGLPEGVTTSDDVTKGIPIGLGDPKRIFTTYKEDGETILHVSGEIYAGLTSLESFENYHLSLQVRWGDRKWEPRLDQKRNSGLLYHCHGDHGAFWNTWMSCLESQVQEKDFGDFITLAGTSARTPFLQDGERSVYDPSGDFAPWKGYLHASIEPDRPHGEWNRIDLYVVGDRSIHVINGKVVMSLSDALDKNGQPLMGGRLQIQSEAAEVEYKAIRLRPIDAFPPVLEQRAFRQKLR